MKIHVIKTGTVKIKTTQRRGRGHSLMRRQLNLLLDREWTDWLPIYVWVIEHPEGLIVVDTGETARTAEPGYFPRWHPYFRLAVRVNIAPEQEIGPQLQARGIHPRDVLTVILTHLHTDHTGGLHHFPNSKIFVNQADYQLAQGFRGKVRGYLSHRWPSWFNPSPIRFDSGAFGPFERSSHVTGEGDVVIVPTPGHTPAHVSVVAESEGRSYFLAGDTSYTEQLLLERHVDGVSPNEETAKQTMNNILRYAQNRPTVYLPTHDPDSQRRLENELVLSQ
jgi:N-acyl homoserine lactone hydrolase